MSLQSEHELILASASKARHAMLQAVGLSVRLAPAHIDEEAIKQSLYAEKASVERAAETLAELKVQKINHALGPTAAAQDCFILGADQMLECGPVWFDKPKDMEQAAAQLQALSGKSHELVSSAVLYKNGERIWHHTEKVRLAMRPLSLGFIATYLDEVGPKVLETVGCYELEGLGAQLFERVDGDYFTVLGLPLLPLLAILRRHGVLLD